MAKKNSKKWYQSKTKWAALLVGLSPILTTIAGFLDGSLDFNVAFLQLSAEIGIVLGVFGIRDLPFINKAK